MKGVLGRKFSDGTYKACCLGEAGLIAGVCEWAENGELHVKETHGDNTYLYRVYDVIGLHDHCGSSKNMSLCALAILNNDGKTWREIAAIVRANPEAYFSRSV